MIYAKLVNGALDYAPNILRHGDRQYLNPSADILLAEGYLPVNDVPAPICEAYYFPERKITQTATEISLGWEIVKSAQPNRDDLIVQKIRETYTLDAEIAINRQRETKPDEFAAYFAVCEAAKDWADEQIEEWRNA